MNKASQSTSGKNDRGYLAVDDAEYFDRHLSPAKRDALLTCLSEDGLNKRTGKWGGPQGPAEVAGCTVFDLARDGLLSINSRRDYAQLTPQALALMAWHPKATEPIPAPTP